MGSSAATEESTSGLTHPKVDPEKWANCLPVRIAFLNRFISGWCAYFALADTHSLGEEADQWLRRRLRQIRWKEWKRFSARKRNLEALGIPTHTAREWAASNKGRCA